MNMGMNFLLTGSVLTALAIGTMAPAMAQDAPVTPVVVQDVPATSTELPQVYFTPVPIYGSPTVNDRFQQAYFSDDRDFFTNRGIARQVDLLFGPGEIIRNSFVENEIARDGRAIYDTYLGVMAYQLTSTPILRTRDLPNPFNQSLLTQPNAQVTNPVITPAQQPVIEPEPVAPAPVTPAPGNRPPVPALW